MITAISELLTDEDRDAIGGAFGVPPVSQFVSTEGLAGCTRPGDAVMRFATDMCIVELVDARDQPVADGTASAKVLVTNLHNHTQPLIRYELTDRLIRHPADGDPYLHAAVEGRADEIFRYGTVTIDPLVIRTVMVKTPGVIDPLDDPGPAPSRQPGRQPPQHITRSSAHPRNSEKPRRGSPESAGSRR